MHVIIFLTIYSTFTIIGANGNRLEICHLFLKLLLLLVILLIKFFHLWLEGAHKFVYISLLLHGWKRPLLLEVWYYHIEWVRLQCSYGWRSTTTHDRIPSWYLVVTRWVGVLRLLLLKGSDGTSGKRSMTLCGTVFSWMSIVIVSQVLCNLPNIIIRWYPLWRGHLLMFISQFNLFFFLFGIIMSWSQSRMIPLLSHGWWLINSVRFWFGGGICSSMFFIGSLFSDDLASVLVRFSSSSGWLLSCSLLGTYCFH